MSNFNVVRIKQRKRVFQGPGCKLRASIRRLREHLQRFSGDKAALMRLYDLEKLA